jgi:hypothetical protein
MYDWGERSKLYMVSYKNLLLKIFSRVNSNYIFLIQCYKYNNTVTISNNNHMIQLKRLTQ